MPKRVAPKVRLGIGIGKVYTTLQNGGCLAAIPYLYPHNTVGPFYAPIHSFTMFNLRYISLFAAFLATSALPQGPPTSEQSEASITGGRLLPCARVLSHCSPVPLLGPIPQTQALSASPTTTLPYPMPSATSPRYGHLRRCSRPTPRARPCLPASRTAYRTFPPRDRLMKHTTASLTRTAVSSPLN